MASDNFYRLHCQTSIGRGAWPLLTLELLIILAGVSHLCTRFFNPKLMDTGTTARKQDLYLNSSAVDCFVECILTTANNASEVAKI
jgi:hypothetical protein